MFRTEQIAHAASKSEEISSAARRTGGARREFQELWFALSRRDWRSVVLVPADEGESAAEAATSLAEVGKQVHELPVTLFVMANPVDYWPALQIVNTAATTSGELNSRLTEALDYASAVQIVADAASAETGIMRPMSGKVIVAIQPVVAEPLGLAVTHAADRVIVCVKMGRTRLASARRTIDLVGRERIAGCLLVS